MFSLGLVKMEQCMREQRVSIVEQYFERNENLTAVAHKFHAKYGRNIDSTSPTAKRVGEKSKKTGCSYLTIYAEKLTTIQTLKEEIQRNSVTFMQNGHGKFRQQNLEGRLSDMLFRT